MGLDFFYRGVADKSCNELAMRPKRGNLEIFSLSFLDIVSCAFGAVVLLVLVSKPQEGANTPEADVSFAESLLEKVMATEDRISNLSTISETRKEQLNSLNSITKTLGNQEALAKEKAGNKTNELEKLDGDLEGLSLVAKSLKRASIRTSSTLERDVEVGGIPVDSDYVIFIIDTSGSMKDIWGRVSKEVINVLTIHPKVKGFQLLNDNGNHLISGYKGKWIVDTPKMRSRVMKIFDAWADSSNSSPVEGLETALKIYAKPSISLSIYIFGDDYSGSSYEPVIAALSKLNTNRINGKRLAKVHAVGFMSNYATNRYPILMREVVKRNGGTFLGLPLHDRAPGAEFLRFDKPATQF